jgi:hypothetical protein
MRFSVKKTALANLSSAAKGKGWEIDPQEDPSAVGAALTAVLLLPTRHKLYRCSTLLGRPQQYEAMRQWINKDLESSPAK